MRDCKIDLLGITPAGPAAPTQAHEIEPTTTTQYVDERPAAGLYLFPRDTTDTALCDNFGDSDGQITSIPCQDIINVCTVGSDGSLSTKWMPEVWRCTDDSPTYATVCAIAPREHWAFYGLDPSRCT